MPRFYVLRGEQAWGFTFFVITLNFVCFVFIAIGYYLIFKNSMLTSDLGKNNHFERESAIMQRRSARIIATDFCCWIPICALTYVRFAVDYRYSNIVYQITAAVLLPINSALNPFLFSSLPDRLFELCRLNRTVCCCKHSN